MLKPIHVIEYKGELFWYTDKKDFKEMILILSFGKTKFKVYTVKYEKVWTKNGRSSAK